MSAALVSPSEPSSRHRARALTPEGATAAAPPPGRRERIRAELAIAGLGVVLLLLLLRLHHLQVTQHEVWLERASKQRQRTETLPPPRGDVLIRDGDRLVPLCASVRAVSVFIAPQLLDDPTTAQRRRDEIAAYTPKTLRKRLGKMLPTRERALPKLAEILAVPAEQRDAFAASLRDRKAVCERIAVEIEAGGPRRARALAWLRPDRMGLLDQLAGILGLSASQRASAEARFRRGLGTWLARRVDPELGGRIDALRIHGVEVRDEPRRAYPFGSLASHVAGVVNVDGEGLSGLELLFDEELRGVPGQRHLETDNAGRVFVTENTHETPAQPGLSAVLTIDRTVQLALEEALDAAMEKWEPKAAWGVFVEVGTGRILAIASRPAVDQRDPGAAAADARRLRVLTDPYEIGSTIKPFVVAVCVDRGLTRFDEMIFCENGRFPVRGRRAIEDVHAYGMLSVAMVLVKSSNVGAVKLAFRLGNVRLAEGLRGLGFGTRSGVEMPGESRGSLRGLDRPSPVALSSVAQGYAMQANALQVALGYEALANGGILHRPQLVEEWRNAEGEVVRKNESTVVGRAVSEETALALRRPLGEVVRSGTARRAKIAEYDVAGKTGTANKAIGGRYSQRFSVLSFAGWAPADDPKVAFCVVVDHADRAKGARYAGSVAAPIATETVRRALPHLGVPPRSDDDD